MYGEKVLAPSSLSEHHSASRYESRTQGSHQDISVKENNRMTSIVIYFIFIILCFSYRDRNDQTGQQLLLFWAGFYLLILGIAVSSIFSFYKSIKGHGHALDGFVITGFIVFCFYILFSSFSSNNEVAINVFVMNISLFTVVLLSTLTFNFSDEIVAVGLAQIFLYASIIISVLGILICYDMLRIEIGSFVLAHNPTHLSRLHSITGDPTSLGAIAGLGVLSSNFLCMKNKSGLMRIKNFFVSLFLVLILVMSGSRAAIVSLVPSMLLLSDDAFNLKRIMKKSIIIFTILSAFLAIMVFMCPANELGSYLIRVFRPDDITQKGTRLDIWTHALGIFANGTVFETFFGHGFNWLQTNYRSSHNTYIEYLVNYGILFIILLLLYLYALFRKALSAFKGNNDKKTVLFATAILVYSLVFAAFLTTLFSKNFYITNFAFISSIVLISKMKPTKIIFLHRNATSQRQQITADLEYLSKPIISK